MSDISDGGRLRRESEPLPPSVRSFLIESQRRVIEHCTRLLAARDLEAEHYRRLDRLAGAAETELRHLAG